MAEPFQSQVGCLMTIYESSYIAPPAFLMISGISAQKLCMGSLRETSLFYSMERESRISFRGAEKDGELWALLEESCPLPNSLMSSTISDTYDTRDFDPTDLSVFGPSSVALNDEDRNPEYWRIGGLVDHQPHILHHRLEIVRNMSQFVKHQRRRILITLPSSKSARGLLIA